MRKFDNDTVNIIIPIYNVEKYLPKCIDSAINQTYDNLRIILVDDGSTDSCPAICEQYAKTDERIYVIHKKNGGLSDARNAGLEAVRQSGKGGYIYFFDSDDYIEKNLVETCVKAMEENKCDIVVMNYVTEDENGAFIFRTGFKPAVYETKTAASRLKYAADTTSRWEKTGYSSWGRFFRQDLIISNNLTYPDNNVIFAEDVAFSLRTALYHKKVVVIKNTLYHYIKRADSIIGKTKVPPFGKFIKLFEDFSNFAKERGFKDNPESEFPFIFSNIFAAEAIKVSYDIKKEAEYIKNNLEPDDLEKLQKWLDEAKRHKAKRFQRCGLVWGSRTALLADALRGKTIDGNFFYAALILRNKIFNNKE